MHKDTNIYLSSYIDTTLHESSGYVWVLNELAESHSARNMLDDPHMLDYTEKSLPNAASAMEAGIRYCHARRPDLVRTAQNMAEEAARYRYNRNQQAS